MPPQPADRLTLQELAVVRAWILGGALSKTASSDEGITDVDRNFWSFRLLAHVTAPKVNDPNSVATPIDRFLLRAAGAQGLKDSPPADRYVLIRRASFDLIGLPPSPEEIQSVCRRQPPGRLPPPDRASARLSPLRRALGQTLAGRGRLFRQ